MLTRRHLLAILGISAMPLRAAAEAPEDSVAEGTPASAGGAPLAFGEARAFDFDTLVAIAKAASAVEYRARPDPAPETVARIDYRQHLDIRQPISGGLFAEPGRDGIVTMFHLGTLFRRPVRIHLVEGDSAREVLYRKGYFAYSRNNPAAGMPDSAGFAGFRVHEPRTTGKPAESGDWLAFLGASYFRSSGDLKQYGISARGLAVESGALDGKGEEFPDFTDFWIEEMRGGVMRIHALLEGPSVAGAFRFDVSHFPNVVMTVACRLFMRRDVVRLGVAPLTSMYWYSQEARWARGDWRPEVHDSDGLLIHDKKGGAIWRTLTNPTSLNFAAFATQRPKGFGLVQRDRNYSSYEDEVAFERRPNLWVEPVSGFDEGSVQLIEFPTGVEFGDNIVAFFVPAKPVEAGDALSFDYRLHWSGKEPAQSLARMLALRLGHPRRHVPPASTGRPPRLERKIILDYEGESLRDAKLASEDIVVALSHGEARYAFVSPSIDKPTGWRVIFDVFVEKPVACEVKVDIVSKRGPLAETVIFRFGPEDGL